MTIDLTENKIPFGLLSEEEQEHLKHWPHGLLYYEGGVEWWHLGMDEMEDYYTYRTIPAPVEPERETAWFVYDDTCGMVKMKDRKDTINYLSFTKSFAFRVEYDAETGDNPTIVKETFDDQ